MYVSQYDARSFATPGIDQNFDTSQLLIGEPSEVNFANTMKLNITQWITVNQPDTTTNGFLTWNQSQINSGYPVIGTVYENSTILGGERSQPGYDHIVSMISASTSSITFWDNGIVSPPPDAPQDPLSSTPAPLFTYTNTNTPYASFIRNRSNAFNSTSYYSIPLVLTSDNFSNNATAVTGITTTGSEQLIRVQLLANFNAEDPVMDNDSNERPDGNPAVFTAYLYNLVPNTMYNLYRYSNPVALPIPTSNFNTYYNINKNTGYVSLISTISTTVVSIGNTTTVTINGSTSSIMILRCVQSTFS